MRCQFVHSLVDKSAPRDLAFRNKSWLIWAIQLYTWHVLTPPFICLFSTFYTAFDLNRQVITRGRKKLQEFSNYTRKKNTNMCAAFFGGSLLIQGLTLHLLKEHALDCKWPILLPYNDKNQWQLSWQIYLSVNKWSRTWSWG